MPRRVVVGVLASLLALALLLGALSVWAWLAYPAPVAGPVSATPNPAHIGDDVALTATVALPWQVRPAGKPLLQRIPQAPPTADPATEATTPEAPTVPGEEAKAAMDAAPVPLPEQLQTLATSVSRGRPGLPSWHWQVKVDLQPLDFGPFEGLELVLPLAGTRPGEPTALHLPVPTLEVTSGFGETLEGAPTQRGDLSPQEEAAAAARRVWLWVALGSVALLALALFLWWRHRRASQGPTEIPLPPPADEALEALDGLEAALPLPGEVYFTRLQDIVRRFIERRYGLPVHAATTPEFLRAVNQPRSPLNLEVRQALAEMLQVGDRVRFALGEADSDTFTAGLATARTLVADAQRQAEAAAKAALKAADKATSAEAAAEQPSDADGDADAAQESRTKELEVVLAPLAPPAGVRADQELAAEEDWRPPAFAVAARAEKEAEAPPQVEDDPGANDDTPTGARTP